MSKKERSAHPASISILSSIANFVSHSSHSETAVVDRFQPDGDCPSCQGLDECLFHSFSWWQWVMLL
jgi:hypothetical protein